MEQEYIKVWPFYEAPEEYRKLSPHGGDEDWLAWIPARIVKEYGGWLIWMESGSSFGVCEVSEHNLLDGSQVRIGAHS